MRSSCACMCVFACSARVAFCCENKDVRSCVRRGRFSWPTATSCCLHLQYITVYYIMSKLRAVQLQYITVQRVRGLSCALFCTQLSRPTPPPPPYSLLLCFNCLSLRRDSGPKVFQSGLPAPNDPNDLEDVEIYNAADYTVTV